MGSQLNDRVGRWVASIGIDPRLAPTPATLRENFGDGSRPCRPGADPDAIDDWERRHGFPLPKGLRNWLVSECGTMPTEMLDALNLYLGGFQPSVGTWNHKVRNTDYRVFRIGAGFGVDSQSA